MSELRFEETRFGFRYHDDARTRTLVIVAPPPRRRSVTALAVLSAVFAGVLLVMAIVNLVFFAKSVTFGIGLTVTVIVFSGLLLVLSLWMLAFHERRLESVWITPEALMHTKRTLVVKRVRRYPLERVADIRLGDQGPASNAWTNLERSVQVWSDGPTLVPLGLQFTFGSVGSDGAGTVAVAPHVEGAGAVAMLRVIKRRYPDLIDPQNVDTFDMDDEESAGGGGGVDVDLFGELGGGRRRGAGDGDRGARGAGLLG